MDESEQSVRLYAAVDEDDPARACAQTVASPSKYNRWISSHDHKMWTVARGKRRDLQIKQLRLVATEQIHRAALVRYLRGNHVNGDARVGVLREFYGALDLQCAVLAEHRLYTQAVSSQVCAIDVLDLIGDDRGVEMLINYQHTYGTFFSMFCDRSRARRDGRRYLLSNLVPEARASAEVLRKQIQSGDLMPPIRLFQKYVA